MNHEYDVIFIAEEDAVAAEDKDAEGGCRQPKKAEITSSMKLPI